MARPINYSVRLNNSELKRLPQGVRNTLKVKRNYLNITAQSLEGGAVVYSVNFRWGGYNIYAVSAVDISDVKERFIAAANSN